MGAVAPALGTLFAPAAAGTAAAGTGIVGTIAGGLISGIGAGLIKKAEYKEEERSRIAEEKRREERYFGVGDAVRFWDAENGGSEENDTSRAGFQRADPRSNESLPVGTAEKRPRMGEKFRNRQKTTPERFRYDRAAGQIVPV